MEVWILFTLLAVLMQALRTAAQKQLSGQLTATATTLSRYLYGLPPVLLYLFWLTGPGDYPLPAVNMRFFWFGSCASLAQIIATILMIRLFQCRSFAVGVTFAKTEALYAAVAGALLFAQPLPAVGWLVVIVGVAGVWLMSPGRNASATALPEVLLGLGSGLGFAFTSLWLREASLALEAAALISAAVTLCYMVALQGLILTVWLWLREPRALAGVFRHWRSGSFIGITSALGSVGWFTAMTLQSVAWVKALGQLEFLLVVLITHRFFRERVSAHEYLGMGLIALSVLILLLQV